MPMAAIVFIHDMPSIQLQLENLLMHQLAFLGLLALNGVLGRHFTFVLIVKGMASIIKSSFTIWHTCIAEVIKLLDGILLI